MPLRPRGTPSGQKASDRPQVAGQIPAGASCCMKQECMGQGVSGEAPELGGRRPPTDLPAAVHVSNASSHVFISYASQDAAVANALVKALEGNGIKCWIAPRDVVPGALYADEIVRAINEAQVVVLILSEQAVASSHVGKEIERASSKRRRIVALRTDDVSPWSPPCKQGENGALDERSRADSSRAAHGSGASLLGLLARMLDYAPFQQCDCPGTERDMRPG